MSAFGFLPRFLGAAKGFASGLLALMMACKTTLATFVRTQLLYTAVLYLWLTLNICAVLTLDVPSTGANVIVPVCNKRTELLIQATYKFREIVCLLKTNSLSHKLL